MKKYALSLLTFASLLSVTSCMDNNYDLSDIDTNSRFNVNGLTVPVNMDPVKLDLMLDIDDDSDIKTDANGNYYFQKEGTFTSDPINVDKIVLTRPNVEFDGKMSVNISLDPTTKTAIELNASDKTVAEIRSNSALMSLLGLTNDTPIIDIHFDNSTTANEIELGASNIDASVQSIETLGVEDAPLSIQVKVNGLTNALNPFEIDNLKIVLPKGLVVTTTTGTAYDAEKGILTHTNEAPLFNNNFVADMSLNVKGINYSQLKEGEAELFDAKNHKFEYKKVCSATGDAVIKFSQLKGSAKFSDILALEQPNAVTYECNIGFKNDLSINSFKGEITYSMDDITVEPVNIGNVPELLSENGTNIDLQNPQIYVDVDNYLSQYGISVNSNLEIKGNNTITAPLNIKSAEKTNIVMAPLNENLYHPTGYDFEEVKNLSTVVGSNEGQDFPSVLNIRVIKPEVPKTNLNKTLELGKDISGVEGKWEFFTTLTLTDKSKVKYTKNWDDWADEDLDGLTVKDATVTVTLQKDVALDAESVEFILLGKKGELRGTTALTGDASQDIVIKLAGTPVSEIFGAKLNVHLNGMNRDLNKDQEIKISNLKVVVNGYYDREL